MKMISILTMLCLLSAVLVGCATASAAPTQNTQTTQATQDAQAANGAQTIKDTQPQEPSLMRFLSQSNRTPASAGDKTPAAPGTPIETTELPQPSQEWVGQQVRFALEKDYENAYAVFHYQPQSGILTVILWETGADFYHPLLMVLRTAALSAEALLTCVREGTALEGEVLAMVNVDYQEGAVYAFNAATEGNVSMVGEKTDLGKDPNKGDFLGACGNGGLWMREADTEMLEVFSRIYTRFDLAALIFGE